MKVWFVVFLEDLCEFLGHPFVCKLASWSEALDDKWNTGVWKIRETE